MDKLRIGVIGVGSVVREIYQYLYYRSSYSPFLEIVGIADPSPEARRWFCDTFHFPAERAFESHTELFRQVELDVAQVNTPDSLHCKPTLDALAAGKDVLVPKPTATTVRDADAMIRAAQENGRLLAVDFHKRGDPRFREAEARYRSGRYGRFQFAVWYMIDKILVVDPNRAPRFFASPDFAERNSPVSFLTVHMADTFMNIVGLKPVEVRATGFSQKLPSLSPVAVKGYDLVDTEIGMENGGVAHIVTGWHLPNSAHSLTVQESRMICTDGLLDLGIDTPGYREIHAEGLFEVNPLYKNFDSSGMVSGYAIDNPGRLLRKILAARRGELDDKARAAMLDPIELGFFTTAVLQAAEESLARGAAVAKGVVAGTPVRIADLLRRELGQAAAVTYGLA